MLSFLLRVAAACVLACLGVIVLALNIGRTLPNGALLTFTGWHDTPRVYVMDVNRLLLIAIPETYRPYQGFYGWSADGQFAFLSDRDGNTEVYLLDGATITNISQSPFVDEFEPAWSADGQLVFVSLRNIPGEIYLWEDGIFQRLTYNEMAEEGLAWSP